VLKKFKKSVALEEQKKKGEKKEKSGGKRSATERGKIREDSSSKGRRQKINSSDPSEKGVSLGGKWARKDWLVVKEKCMVTTPWSS